MLYKINPLIWRDYGPVNYEKDLYCSYVATTGYGAQFEIKDTRQDFRLFKDRDGFVLNLGTFKTLNEAKKVANEEHIKKLLSFGISKYD